MPAHIFYNNSEILSGQPTPLVSRNDSVVRYGERWADLVTIKLDGQITGCPADFSGLLATQLELLSIFDREFGTLAVYDDSNLVFSAPNCNIKNGVRFDAGNYNGIIRYSVELDSYPESLFSGFYGVLDPQDQWELTEQEGGRFSATHTIAAKGIITTSGASDALQNAMDFVNSRTGNFAYATPYFFGSSGDWQDCPKRIAENKNRVNGTYGLSITYDGSAYDNDSNILRYTTETACNADNNLLTVDLRGEIQGCSLASISDVRAKYTGLDFAALLSNSLSGLYVNSIPTTSGIEENPFTPSISFRLSYDNFTGSYPYFSYSTVIESGESDIINVKIDGTVRHRGSNIAKWDEMMAFYQTIDLFPIAEVGYDDFGGSGDLNSFPSSSGVSFNKFGGEIGLRAEFNDKYIPVSGFESLDYSLDYTPSLQKVVTKPLLATSTGTLFGSEYYVCDLAYKNRCDFSVRGNGVVGCGYTPDQATTYLKAFANSLFAANCPNSKALLESNVITTGVRSLSFDFKWSANSANNVVVPKTNYNNINSLSLA